MNNISLDIFWTFYYLFVLSFVLVLVYLSYCSFVGKPFFIPFNFYSIVLVVLIFGYPFQINNFLNFLPHSLVLIFLIMFFFFARKDTYIFYNTTKETRAIVEQAFKNLEINYESLPDQFKLNKVENINRIYSMPKNNIINFDKFNDRNLRKKIIQEIRTIMYTYKQANRLKGVLSIAMAFAFMGLSYFSILLFQR